MKLIPTISEDINIPENFKGLCDSPRSLLNYIASSLLFTVPDVDNIYIGEKAPKGKDRGKIWIKTTFPYGIGKLLDGEWRIDYGMFGYPVNTPFLHKKLSVLPEGMKELSDADLDTYGIPKSTSTSTDKMFWYLLETPDQTDL